MLSAAVAASSSKSFLQTLIPTLVLFMFFRCCEKMVEYPGQLGNATGILKASLEASDIRLKLDYRGELFVIGMDAMTASYG
ncbi:hypothetical protein TNCV_4191751 [Trichonephila clavipes]|nr:hypothetical protein TNCV_4191751 [Trichonephila clavipes]